MAKDKAPQVDLNTADATAPVAGGVGPDTPMPHLAFSVWVRPTFEVEVSITQILDNNISYLDSLRRSLESTNNKAIHDVRLYGDTVAAAMLSGFEGTVGYENLVDIIDDMKAGVARRRVALAEAA